MSGELTLIVAGVTVVILVVLLVALLAAQRRVALELTSLRAGHESDRSSALLQQQIESLRDQVGRALAETTANVNQQLDQLSGAMGRRLHEQSDLAQQTQRLLGERLDNTAQVVSAVQRSLGGLEEANRRIYDIGKDIASLQEILRAPKLRGGLGELLLEDLLAQILPEANVVTQHAFREGQKVDAAIRLAGGLVPIDAKFPLENFRRLLECENDEDRTRLRRTFVADVKKHIDAIASKYIVPAEGTFDFALMYIPAENVYYEIIVKDDVTGEAHLAEYAMQRRVIPVSPGSFYAYLQAIVLGLRGLQVEQRAQDILRHLSQVRAEFDRFRDEFRLIAKHLANASSATGVADRRLEKLDARLAALVAEGCATDPVRDAAVTPATEGGGDDAAS